MSLINKYRLNLQESSYVSESNRNEDTSITETNNDNLSIFDFNEDTNNSYDLKESNNENEWVDVEPKENSFLGLKTGGYTYTTSDGTIIKLDDIEGVQIRQNKKTGEIIVIGAENAKIDGSDSDVKIRIYNSSIEDISMGNGNDDIYIENSVVNKVSGGKGNDKIEISKTNVTTVEGGKGNDDIKIYNESKTTDVKGNEGNDAVYIEDSAVTGNVSGNNGDDYIYSLNSNIFSITGEDGEDDILIDTSKIDQINGGKDDDVIIVNNSDEISVIIGENGNDLINIINSKVNKLDGGKGADSITTENTKVNELVNDDDDKTVNKDTVETQSPIESLDDVSVDSAVNIANNKSSEYSDRELTPEEQVYALTIDFFSQNLNNMKEAFDAQENSDGKIRDAYNYVKQLLDLGIAKNDIEDAIKEQEEMIAELTAALNGESNSSFEEVFKKWTGVEYNQDNITEYLETAQMYSLAVNGLTKTESFKDMITDASNLGQVLDYFSSYYGSEEAGRKKLNELLQESFMSNPEAFGYVQSVEINDKNQLVITRPKEWGAAGPVPNTEYETTVEEISDVTNMLKTMQRFFDIEQYTTEYMNTFENIAGISIEELQDKYRTSQLNTFGSGNSFQKLIDKYCEEQDGFADKLASIAQIGGIGLMVIGGVVTFVCPPAGVMLMQAGKYTSLAGMFGDNALDLIDNLSSENGISKEQAWELAKETITELLLLYSGQKINGIAGSVKNEVLNSTQNKVLAFLSEIGTDASLSLLTDLMITGELDITGEGISQLLGIITGIAGAKINSYTKKAFEGADALFKQGDANGAYDHLKSKGLSNKQIYNYYKTTELDRILSIYKETGDYAAAIKQANESKILNYKSKSDIENEILNQCLNFEYENAYKMFEEGHSWNEIKTYLEKISFISEDNINAIGKNIETKSLINKLNKKYHINLSKYKNIDFASKQGNLIAEDIKLMYIAAEKGIDVNDLMVPKISDITSELENVSVGSVFEVEGNNNIFIKTADGKYKELNISKNAYCRLFPAVDRYVSGQQDSGDCYLVSALNTMLSNTKTRELLLSCFTENADGSITVKMPDSNTKIIIKPGQKISDLGVNPKKAVSGALGVQLLEYLYKVNYTRGNVKQAQRDVELYIGNVTDIYNENIEYFKSVGINDPLEIATYLSDKNANLQFELKSKYGVSISDEEMKSFLTFMQMDNYLYNSDGTLNDNGIKYISKVLGIDDVDILNTIVSEYKSKYGEITDYLLNADYYAMLQSNYTQAQDLLNKEYDFKEIEEKTGKGGISSNVFKAFGQDNVRYDDTKFSPFFDTIIANPDLQKDYVITTGTTLTKSDHKKRYNDPTSPNYKYYHDNPDIYNKLLSEAPDNLPYGLVPHHAYSFEVTTNDAGETVIKVTNPWTIKIGLDNLINPKVITLTVEEFKKYFDHIYYAKIPQN